MKGPLNVDNLILSKLGGGHTRGAHAGTGAVTGGEGLMGTAPGVPINGPRTWCQSLSHGTFFWNRVHSCSL